MANIMDLTTDPCVRPVDCMGYLQDVIKAVETENEAKHLLDHIAAIVSSETNKKDGSRDSEGLVNQAVLNLCFRSYYTLVERFKLPDTHFATLTHQPRDSDFLMLNALLSTGHPKCLDVSQLVKWCLEAMSTAINENRQLVLLAIVKSLNLLCRRDASLDFNITLEHIYYLMQCQVSGMREETLMLFSYCVKDAGRAAKNFLLINEFWPWTNKIKYFLLSCILNVHSLKSPYIHPEEAQNFFAGLRLSLKYKRLFSAGQHLVKSLSCQESTELLELSAEILTRGSRSEITNFQSQWFGRILQKDELFILLQSQLELADALQHFSTLADTAQRYRLILIFGMFSRQVLQLSKLHFFKISTELITNCFDLELESRPLVFKFVVDNLANFAIEDCLEFLLRFIETHKAVESAQYRNNILAKLPTILNYISKTFSRLGVNDCSTLRSSIKSFFVALQRIVDIDVDCAAYQPKIFALKLLEILIRSLYSQAPVKNAKNCCIAQNQLLGRFLVEQEQVFNSADIQLKLLTLLHDPQGYDDAQELLVALLKELNYADTQAATEFCRKIVQHCDLDECALSSLYAEVAVNSFVTAETPNAITHLFGWCFETLGAHLEAFSNDPLLVCKTKNHLFGFLETLNACVAAEPKLLQSQYRRTLNILEYISNTILKMLNLSTHRGKQNEADADRLRAADFQDMDESLELLVQRSAFAAEAVSTESCRKFLLMSFWLTLKACCELATVIGCHLVPYSESDAEHFELLQQCLQVNVTVLVKCRHKGAIEAAGQTIGKLTKDVTAQLQPDAKAYQMLHSCVEDLFSEHGQQLSTTRRGAGLSIMFLHVVKNEQHSAHPLLRLSMRKIFDRLNVSQRSVTSRSDLAADTTENCDRLEALILHFLCVLVKDTELRWAMSKYHDSIMMAAIKHIDNPEWTVCNAALQLFGALVPKIVGQNQATDFEAPVGWEPTELTYMEITLRLPKTCAFILNYCTASQWESSGTSIRSITLFLSFLSKVEHLRKRADDNDCELQSRLRKLMWSLLAHRAETVRKLAAVCFVRAHEFRCDLPLVLLKISKVLFGVRDENFFHGLLYVLNEGIVKMQQESVYTMDTSALDHLVNEIKLNLAETFQPKKRNLYSLCKLLELMVLLGYESQSDMVRKLVSIDAARNCIGIDVFRKKVTQLLETV